MAKIGGYRSPVNLGLGRVPLATDQDMFAELTDVYNSIHLLASYMDTLRLSLEGGGGGQTPIDTLPFNRYYPSVALVDITAGQVVSPTRESGQNGTILGALHNVPASTTPESNFAGIALNDALVGETVRVGVGPGVIELSGATSGSLVWAYSSLSTTGFRGNNGNLYTAAPASFAAAGGGTVYATPIGICIADGYAYIDNFINRT